MPVWPSLRAQVVHTDLTTDNALADDAGNVTGIVDFGDMSHSALIVDLASLLDSLLDGRTDGRAVPLCPARRLDGYQRDHRRSNRSSCACSASSSRRVPR